MHKIACIFPGQGSQYPGMSRSFADEYSLARQTFEEADDLLGRKISKIIFDGPEDVLTQTHNSQTGIFVSSIATLRVLEQQFPELTPALVAGLSLGEYTALCAGGFLSFSECLQLVDYRGRYMSEACEQTRGTMAVVMGLPANEVEEMVQDLCLPEDLWSANFNCPGQVVISGTEKGIAAGIYAAKARGAKRVLPLQVHGAFHSGLMETARQRLEPHILQAGLQSGSAQIAMNVPGDLVSDIQEIRRNLIQQVVCPVRWEQDIQVMQRAGASAFISIGCGKSLTNMNKRNGVTVPNLTVEAVDDLCKIEEFFTCAHTV